MRTAGTEPRADDDDLGLAVVESLLTLRDCAPCAQRGSSYGHPIDEFAAATVAAEDAIRAARDARGVLRVSEDASAATCRRGERIGKAAVWRPRDPRA
jgi:hypothetical protein